MSGLIPSNEWKIQQLEAKVKELDRKIQELLDKLKNPVWIHEHPAEPY